MNITQAKPKLFYKPSTSIWTDSYIHQDLLNASNTDAVSINPQAIQATVDFINNHIKQPSHILDLGSGPSLYAQRFKQNGHQVTGVDFNKAAIEREYTHEHNPGCQFIHADYLPSFPTSQYDAITLIYCDIGTHSDHNRDLLLKNCYQALNPGGKLIFDVSNESITEHKKEEKTWEHTAEANFWSAQPHLLLKQTFHYPESKALAEQYHLITDEKTQHFLIWERYYSAEEIISLLENIGFKNIKVKENLLPSNHKILVIAEKQ